MTMILGYSDRGMADNILLLLEYTGEKYETKQYDCGPAPCHDKSQWIKEKDTLGLDFPKLPYLIDGPFKVTERNAILRHIARKHNMCGESESEIIRVDMLESQAMEFDPFFESLKGHTLAQLEARLKQISQFLGERKWFAGDKITFVDFLFYDIIDQRCVLEPTCLDSFPNLKNFFKRIEALENIAAYMKSSRFTKTPGSQPTAHCL